MNEEEIKDELGQHNDQLKLQDKVISQIEAKIRLLAEYAEKLIVCGFTPTNHSPIADDARNRMTEIVHLLRTGKLPT